MSGIRLSKEYGVNPTMTQCFYCCEPKDILLVGASSKRMFGTDEAPRMCGILDREPCQKCKEHMKAGIIIISVDESKSDDEKNPYRTGGWWVIKEEAIRRMLGDGCPDLLADILKRRAVFMPDEVCDMIGLVKGDYNAATEKADAAAPDKAAGGEQCDKAEAEPTSVG